MSQSVLVGLTAILALGVLAQWLAWRIRVPAILLLLLFGCLAGPGSEWLAAHQLLQGRFLDPTAMFGELLLPVVSLAVAVILFEGGLTLNVAELSHAGQVIWRLVSIGAVVTWLIGTAATHWLIRLDWPLAALFGAVLVVTGPTVIGPLLRHVRPTGRVGPIVKWEGIVIDPIGAMLAVLVFEAMPIRTEMGLTLMVLLRSGVMTLGVAAAVAFAGAGLVILLLRKRWIADYLETPVTLAIVVSVFTGANLLQPESGLFATTAMGVILANQSSAVVHHIAEFKENLRLLLVSSLFIVIGARLQLSQIDAMGWRQVALVATLVFVARPVAVLASTVGTSVSWRERAFLAWMAPRGVVAAAVTSVFAIRLMKEGYQGANLLVPTIFAVIIGTVAVYGLTASFVARWLGLAKPESLGVLIVGANSGGRMIASSLIREGLEVLLVDTNRQNIAAARLDGLPVHYGSINSARIARGIELSGIGRLLALTPNEEVNALASLHFSRPFGRSQVYQLASESSDGSHREKVRHQLRGRVLFSDELTFHELNRRVAAGAAIKKTKLTQTFTLAEFRKAHGDRSVPLFLVDLNGATHIVSAEETLTTKPGQSLIYLSDPSNTKPVNQATREPSI